MVQSSLTIVFPGEVLQDTEGAGVEEVDENKEQEQGEEGNQEDILFGDQEESEMKPAATPTTKSASKSASAISSAGSSPFCMNISFPYILYHYLDNGLCALTIDFLIIGQKKEFFRPKVVPDGQVFQLGMIIPPIFTNEARLLLSHFDDLEFNHDTNKATALTEVCAKHTGHLDIVEPLLGEPMQIKLPFKCEDDIRKWEIVALDNSAEFSTEVGNQQYYFLLSVDLLAADKLVKKKPQATFRNLGTPPGGAPGGGGRAGAGSPAMSTS